MYSNFLCNFCVDIFNFFINYCSLLFQKLDEDWNCFKLNSNCRVQLSTLVALKKQAKNPGKYLYDIFSNFIHMGTPYANILVEINLRCHPKIQNHPKYCTLFLQSTFFLLNYFISLPSHCPWSWLRCGASLSWEFVLIRTCVWIRPPRVYIFINPNLGAVGVVVINQSRALASTWIYHNRPMT